MPITKPLLYFRAFVLPLGVVMGFALMGAARAATGDWQLTGNASASGNQLVLTANSNSQHGAIWHKSQLNLASSFSMTATIFAGSSDGGADGMSFVMQRDSSGLTTSSSGQGEWTGTDGIFPAVAVELDTYQNGGQGDPACDHVGVNLYPSAGTGQPNHSGTGPTCLPNIENNATHTFTVNWDATAKTLTVLVDGVTYINAYNNDLVNNIFGGQTKVYFGYTASTGGLSNQHYVVEGTLTPQAELTLADTVSSATPAVGQTLTYTLTATNNGPNTATGVTVTAPLPSGLSFTATGAGSQGVYNSGTGVWTVPSLNSGSNTSLVLQATVQASAAGTTKTITANVSASDLFDDNTANNTATRNLNIPADTTGPTGGTLSYATSSTTTANTVNYGAVTDAATGVASNVMKVAEATLAAGACGAFGAFANTPNQPASTAAGSISFTAQQGKCYKFRYVLTDVAGNVTTVDPGTVLMVTPPGLSAPANVVDGTVAGTDLDATSDTTRLSAVWDAVTGAVAYAYAIGTTAGGTELVAFTEINTNSVTHVVTGLPLVGGQRYYISVRAKDSFGVLGTMATSDGLVVDTTAPSACAVSGFFAVAGAACQFGSGTTFYYNNNTACNGGEGQVSVAVSAGTDAESGHAKLIFPNTLSTGGDVNTPGSALAYTWTAASNFEGAATVTTVNGTGATNTCSFTMARDILPPTGGVASVAAYAGSTQVSVTLTAAQDAGAGVASVVLQSAQAAVNNGVCGAFGDYATTLGQPMGILGETVNFSGTSGNCYQFRTLLTDRVGNQLINAPSTAVLVDTQAPETAMTQPAAAFQGSTTFTVTWTAGDGAAGAGVESVTVQYRDGETGLWQDWQTATTSGSGQFTGQNGHTYFFRVTARDKAGNVSALPTNPDYHLKTEVDTQRLSSPALLSDGSGGQDADYAADATSYSGSWSAVAGAVRYQYALGTTAGGNDVRDWADTAQTSVNLTGLALAQGVMVYLSVRGVNRGGVVGNTGSTDGLLIDTTAPAAPVVTDEGTQTREAGRLVFGVSASDAESGLASLYYALGLAPGATDVRDWREMPLGNSLELTDLDMSPGKTYFLSVRAVNRAGLVSATGVTDGILRVSGALVQWITIPEKLVAQVEEFSDVQVPVEFVYTEKGGADARFSRMDLRWRYRSGLEKELPEQVAELNIPAQSEWRQKTTLVIPWEVASFALSGLGEADLVMERTWRGLDGNGNDSTFVQAIPIRLTKTGVSTPLEVGEIAVTVEGSEGVVPAGAKARALVSFAGRGAVAGQWLVNGEVVEDLSFFLTTGNSAELPLMLGALKDGENTLQLRITQPEYKESTVVRFTGKAGAVLGGEALTDFWAGPFNVTGVSAKSDPGTGGFSGEGLLQLPLAEEPVSIVFENLRLAKQQEKVAVKKNALVGMTDFSFTKGAARLKLSKVMVGPAGVVADGEIFIKETTDTPGLGPLYFYGLEITPLGFSGEVELKDPQKGALGVFTLEISKLRFSFKKLKTTVKAEGVLLVKTGERSVDVRLPLVFETLPGGGVRMSGGSAKRD